MTENEAIDILSNNPVAFPDVIVQEFWDKAICKSIFALGKQVPQKPIGTHYAHMTCPNCNHRIPSGMGSSSRRRDNWCNYCGQRIDWT